MHEQIKKKRDGTIIRRSLNKTLKKEDRCVQTGGGSDVVVKINPNMITQERQ